MADFRKFIDKTKSYTKDELETAKILDDTLQYIEDIDNPGNYRYIGTTGELLKDIAHPEEAAFNGLFGDRFVAHRVPKFATNFSYPASSKGILTTVVGTGAIDYDVNMLRVQTGETTGSSALIKSRGYLRYTAGRDAEAMFTAIYTAGVAGTKQYHGLFDDSDGFMIGMEGTDFCVIRRKDGAQDEIITQDNFNFDKLDGTGECRFTLDPTMINIFRITYGYLGTAPIKYQISVPVGKKNKWVTFHQIDRRNKVAETSVRIPYLPIAMFVDNGITTSNIVARTASVYAGVIDGSGQDVAARYFTKKLSSTPFAAGEDQDLVVFHSKATFQGLVNHIESLLLFFDAAVEGNKPVQIDLYKLANQTRDAVTYTWEDVDTADSIFEVSADQPIDDLANSELLMSFTFGKSDSKQLILPEYLNINLYPDEYAGFVVSSAGITEVIVGLRWKELF